MVICVDPQFKTPMTKQWMFTSACHLMIFPLSEIETLHAFAKKIGLRREWFQEGGTWPHYDLTITKRQLAIKEGATEITNDDLKKLMQQERNK